MLPNTHLRVIPTQAVALSALRLLREGAGQSFAFEQIRPRPELPEIAIRALGPEDARAFRNIALEALNRDGHFFATELAREAARSDAEWLAACTETADHAVFGGFVGNRLVGIMAARRWECDESGRSVCWGSAYVQPAHRRTGVGRFLYGTREQWSKQRGFAAAVIAIREDNARSIEIHSKNDAVRFGVETMRYADGTEGLTHWYRKALLRVA